MTFLRVIPGFGSSGHLALGLPGLLGIWLLPTGCPRVPVIQSSGCPGLLLRFCCSPVSFPGIWLPRG